MKPVRRRRSRPFNSERYGMAHKALRARLAPVVATGEVRCARCNELIAEGEAWQLDHRDDGRGWLGPSHKACNLRSGWEAMIASASGNGNGGFVEEEPQRWSRRWFEEPAVGTEVRLGGGLVEVHVGRGRWQQVAR